MNEQVFQKRLKNYLYGGSTALLLTLATFSLVLGHVISGAMAVLALLGFALCQFIVQLYFFLHLGEEKRPFYRNVSLLFTILMVVILVAGSIWVMWHLNYNMDMTPEQMNKYMIEQNQKGF